MTGEKAKVENPEGQPEGGVPKPEAQTKTYTQEELDAEKETTKAEELAKYQGIQRTIAKKDMRITELERMTQVPSTGSTKTLSKIVDELDRQAGTGYTDDPAAQSRISILRAELAREEAVQAQETVSRQKRVELNQKIIDAGLDPSDDMFIEVDEAFDLAYALDGKFERAERKLARVLKSAKAPEGTLPTETEAEKKEKHDKEIEEAAQKILKEKYPDIFASDTGGPSGATGSDAEFKKKFGAGELPLTKANKERYEKIRDSY